MSEVMHIEIAGKLLPVRIEEGNREDLLKAVRLINEKMAEFEKNYAIKDKSELLAMVTLYLVSYMAKKEKEAREEIGILHRLMEELQSMLTWYKKERERLDSESDSQ
jgi:cell division protein ZapA (FtsZ GTPase activity inhibitor)